MVSQFHDLWEAVVSVIKTMGPWDILDIALLSVVMYYFYKLMRETRAGQLFKGIVFLLFLYAFVKVVKLKAITYLLERLFSVSVLAILIVFQPEVRRAVEKLGHSQLGLSSLRFMGGTDDAVAHWSKPIDEICKACAALSRTKTGADSDTLTFITEKIACALGLSRAGYLNALLSGFLLSCDVAHALHPNKMEMYDSGVCALLNKGVTLKLNYSQKYATDAVGCVLEGSRPLLAEVQSLLCPSVYGAPRRTAVGMDVPRFNMLLAVLERRAGLRLSDKDAYLSVAGSLRLQDRGADLAAVLCVASAAYDKPVPAMTAAIGEVGLTGDVRPVGQMSARLKECLRLGYASVIVPEGTRAELPGLKLIHVKNVLEASSLIAYPKE